MPTVVVLLPLVFNEYLHPFVPILIPALLVPRLSFTPGAILILFLNLNPINFSSFLLYFRENTIIYVITHLRDIEKPNV